MQHVCMDASVHKVQVGDRLRVAIEALGVTQIEVARSIGISGSRLHNWIRGVHYPDPLEIVKLAQRWNITADWLLRGEIAGTVSPLADALWKSVSASEEGPKAAAPPATGTRVRKRKTRTPSKSP